MDEVNDRLIRTLHDENRIINKSLEFRFLPNNAAKIELVQKLLSEYDSIPMLPFRTIKNNKKSDEFRHCGMKWYSHKGTHHFDALQNYNESICYAENNSENLYLGYACRSAVYFDWKLYEICLQNIEQAKRTNDPAVMDELVKREIVCKRLIEKKTSYPEEDVFVPKLSYLPHPKIPFIADCLDLRENEEFGRHIITNSNIKPGEVLAIEDSYFNILLPKLRYQRCTHCLSENFLSLIPCEECTCAMFCSNKCFLIATNTYHFYECSIIDYLHEHFNRIHLSALRSTLTAYISVGNVSRMKTILTDAATPVTVFSLDYNSKSQFDEYLQIHTLPTKQDDRSISDLFQRASVAAVLYNQLMNNTELKNLVRSEKEKHVLMELLFKHLQIASMYFHTMSMADIQYKTCQGGIRGSGVYPFCSLLNHSCAPNIVRIPFGTKMVVFSLRAIKKGKQLFDNYGSHHYSEALEDRQQSMKVNYLFTCQCLACINDYPKFFNLPTPNIKNIITIDDTLQLKRGNKKYAIANYERFSRYLTKYDKYYPCSQINKVQHHFRESLHLMADNVSIKFRY